MAKGLEVVQAVLAGQEVRHGDRWYQWDPAIGKFRMLYRQLGDAEYWCPSSRQLLTDEWEIGVPAMTFAEADAAMLAGKVVQRGATGMSDRWLWRKSPAADWYQCADPLEGGTNWGGGSLEFDDIHATDWRVVEDPAEVKDANDGRSVDDRRPTLQAAASFLKDNFAALAGEYNDTEIKALQILLSHETNATWLAERVVAMLRIQSPAMFREEDASC